MLRRQRFSSVVFGIRGSDGHRVVGPIPSVYRAVALSPGIPGGWQDCRSVFARSRPISQHPSQMLPALGPDMSIRFRL